MVPGRRSYRIRDVAARTSSLVLFSILLGLAVQFGVSKIVEPGTGKDVWFNFGTFLVTAIRFYHGNSIFHEKPRQDSPLRFMVDFYFNIVTLVILCVAGRFIAGGILFAYALLALSGADILWSLSAMVFFYRFRDCKEFFVWCALNAVSIAYLLVIIRGEPAPPVETSIDLFVFYGLVAVADYVFCRDYYFYESPSDDLGTGV